MKKVETSTGPRKSEKYLQERNSLSEELRPLYDRLVEEYAFYALQRYGGGWVAYGVMADLIKAGWKPKDS
jgi:hypothetical protein